MNKCICGQDARFTHVCLNGNTLPAQRPERAPFEELLRRATVATMPEQELREGIEKYRQRALAAESALASARDLPALWRKQADEYPRLVEAAYAGAGVKSCADELEKALSSAPSPAPCYGCASARELLVLWYHNRAWTESGELIEVETQNWLKEHP